MKLSTEVCGIFCLPSNEEYLTLSLFAGKHVCVTAISVFFRHQAGRYAKALELADRAKQIEEEELGARPDKMADIYQLCGVIMDEVTLLYVTANVFRHIFIAKKY